MKAILCAIVLMASFSIASEYPEFQIYRIDVSKNGGSNYWCIEELKFFDEKGERIATPATGASAETEYHSVHYPAAMAFNELSNADHSYYCSRNGIKTGWLQFNFGKPTKLSQYAIESLNGYQGQFSPRDWKFEGSNDGSNWTLLDEQIGVTDLKLDKVNTYTFKAPDWSIAHCTTLRIDVSKNAGAGYWCIEELKFYDDQGNRLATTKEGGSAESTFSEVHYGAYKAFNEISNNDHSYYCSKNGVRTGWLQYEFGSKQKISKYEIERINGHGNQFSPVDWKFQCSNDGGKSWATIDEQTGHTIWANAEVKTFMVDEADPLMGDPEGWDCEDSAAGKAKGIINSIGGCDDGNGNAQCDVKKDKCADLCLNSSACKGFDYERGKGVHTCRLFGQDQPRIGKEFGRRVWCREEEKYEKGTYPNFPVYRIDVSKNGGQNYWCIEEMKFYDEKGERIPTPENGASAETEHNVHYKASMAFNEVSNADHSYYCSKNGVKTGWLEYDFGKDTKLSSYALESLNGYQGQFSPNNWKFYGSRDGGENWVLLDEQTGVTDLKTDKVNNYPFKTPNWSIAHCTTLRMDVKKNAGAGYWCIEELKFYDDQGKRLEVTKDGGEAESTYQEANYGAFKAFNEISNNDHSYYCSKSGIKTGWLQYTFPKKQKISKYEIERINGHGNIFSPVDWDFLCSNDGGKTWATIDEQTGHKTWANNEVRTFMVDEADPLMGDPEGWDCEDSSKGIVSSMMKKIKGCDDGKGNAQCDVKKEECADLCLEASACKGFDFQRNQGNHSCRLFSKEESKSGEEFGTRVWCVEEEKYVKGTYPNFPMYKIDVSKNGGQNYWCIEEMKFFDDKGERIPTPAEGASAETEHNVHYKASMAFNELSNADHSYYCSKNGVKDGWLIYDFGKDTKLSSYALESLNGYQGQFSPNDWKFYGSRDGGENWVLLDEQTGVTDLKLDRVNNYPFKAPNWSIAHCTTLRIDVSKNAGAGYWCIEELKFYDDQGNRLATTKEGGSAESTFSEVHYGAYKAFNEISNNDHSYYCSKNGVRTGWLQYTFKSKQKISKYELERINGHGNQFSPVDWKFQCSNDDGKSWAIIDEQTGHTTWGNAEVKAFMVDEADPDTGDPDGWDCDEHAAGKSNGIIKKIDGCSDGIFAICTVTKEKCAKLCEGSDSCVGFDYERDVNCRLFGQDEPRHGKEFGKRVWCREEEKYVKGTYPNFPLYRIDVSKNGGQNYWCIEELKFFDEQGERLATPPEGASAQTEHNAHYNAQKAFNELTKNDESYYCSKNGHKVGWLQYDFGKDTKLSSYQIESLNGYQGQFSPNDWKFWGSRDNGENWVLLDEQTGVTNLKLEQINTYPFKAPEYSIAHCTTLRLDVSKNAGAGYWCLEELKFYDDKGERLEVTKEGGSAESTFQETHYGAYKAFNEILNNDHSYYCSKNGVRTGWLQYTFKSKQKISKYEIERINGHGNQFSPVDWEFKCSNDDGKTWATIDTQTGHTTWNNAEIKTFMVDAADPDTGDPEGWNCEGPAVGQGGVIRKVTGCGDSNGAMCDVSKDKCAELCLKSENCKGFDYERHKGDKSCRMYGSQEAHHGEEFGKRVHCIEEEKYVKGTFPDFPIYRIDVEKNGGANYWCIEELKFYDHKGNRLATPAEGASAETEFHKNYEAAKGFNELSDADQSYYCSKNGVKTGWLEYDFGKDTKLSQYQIESLNGYQGQFSPNDWKFWGSRDGENWVLLDEQYGVTDLKLDRVNTYPFKNPDWEIAHCTSVRMDVSKSAGAGYWCLEELKFYDDEGKRIATPAEGASAETEFHQAYEAAKGFNELTDNDQSYYCSKNTIRIGWLRYDFTEKQKIAKYEIERLNGYGNQFSPVDWVFECSNDDGHTWVTIDEQAGHSSWSNAEVRSFMVDAADPLCGDPDGWDCEGPGAGKKHGVISKIEDCDNGHGKAMCDVSKDECADLCLGSKACVGFDFERNNGDQSCRLFGQDQPRFGEAYGTRVWCVEEEKYVKGTFPDYRYYKMDVSKNGGSNYWCIEELKFYDDKGKRLATPASGASAESEFARVYGPETAFNELTNNDHSYYCSKNGIKTGWLQYDFGKETKLSKYEVESLNGYQGQFSPNDWTFWGSRDGENWVLLDTQTGVTNLKLDKVNIYPFVHIKYPYVTCQIFRIDVSKNAGAGYWCLEELKFFDEIHKRLDTPESGASAETEYAGHYRAGRAFNEIAGNDDSYYCSKNGIRTGWLKYDFGKKVKVAKYELERLNGHGNQFSPVDWKFECSNDGKHWMTIDEQTGHSNWANGEIKPFPVDPSEIDPTWTDCESNSVGKAGGLLKGIDGCTHEGKATCSVSGQWACEQLCANESHCKGFDFKKGAGKIECRLYTQTKSSDGFDGRIFCPKPGAEPTTYDCTMDAAGKKNGVMAGVHGCAYNNRAMCDVATQIKCEKICSKSKGCMSMDFLPGTGVQSCRLFGQVEGMRKGNAYKGRAFCVNPVKPCDSHPCHKNAICENHMGEAQCSCKDGFVGDGHDCNKPNPCLSNNGGCHEDAYCTNNNGEPTCTCNAEFIGNGKNCKPIHPCDSGNHGCEHVCEKFGDEYICICPDGYKLKTDNHACERINPCDTENGGCCSHAICTNNNGKAKCACESGYEGDGYSCTKINPCENNNGGCHLDHASCENNDGVAVCKCDTGYEGDGKTCDKVNPCENNGPCGGNFNCKIHQGEASCHCKDGLEYNEETKDCDPINPCKENHGGCHENASCNNNNGVAECNCLPGFVGTGKRCTLIHPCDDGSHGCEHNCMKDGKSYICTCHDLYDLQDDNKSCVLNNPCLTNNGGCDARATCTNNKGVAHCECIEGFEGNGKVCTEIDPCNINNGECHPDAICKSDGHTVLSCKCKEGLCGDGKNKCESEDACMGSKDNEYKLIAADSYLVGYNCGHSAPGDWKYGHCDETSSRYYLCKSTSSKTDKCALHDPPIRSQQECARAVEKAIIDGHCHPNGYFFSTLCNASSSRSSCICQAAGGALKGTAASTVGNDVFQTLSGQQWEAKDPCEPNPCHADATCEAVKTEAKCTCNKNFVGDGKITCESEQKCLHDPANKYKTEAENKYLSGAYCGHQTPGDWKYGECDETKTNFRICRSYNSKNLCAKHDPPIESQDDCAREVQKLMDAGICHSSGLFFGTFCAYGGKTFCACQLAGGAKPKWYNSSAGNDLLRLKTGVPEKTACQINHGGCLKDATCTEYKGKAYCQCQNPLVGDGISHCESEEKCLAVEGNIYFVKSEGKYLSGDRCGHQTPGDWKYGECDESKTKYAICNSWSTEPRRNLCHQNDPPIKSQDDCAKEVKKLIAKGICHPNGRFFGTFCHTGGKPACYCQLAGGATPKLYTSKTGNDLFQLVPDDPCMIDNGGCLDTATCTNIRGMASCTCKEGLVGDGELVCETEEQCLSPEGNMYEVVKADKYLSGDRCGHQTPGDWKYGQCSENNSKYTLCNSYSRTKNLCHKNDPPIKSQDDCAAAVKRLIGEGICHENGQFFGTFCNASGKMSCYCQLAGGKTPKLYTSTVGNDVLKIKDSAIEAEIAKLNSETGSNFYSYLIPFGICALAFTMGYYFSSQKHQNDYTPLIDPKIVEMQ